MQEALLGLVGALSALLGVGAGYLRLQARRNGSNGTAGVVAAMKTELSEMHQQEVAWRASVRPILTEMAASLAVLRDRR